MRALWGKAPFQYDLRQVPAPTPGAGEALVRVTGCGICGTDLHFLRAMNRDWTPLGHEISGRIEQVGAGVSRLRPGDTVIVENNSGCGVCEACKNGESRYCRNIWTFMNDQAGMGDFVCIPETSLQTYQDLTPVQACAAEPLTVAIDVTLRADPLTAVMLAVVTCISLLVAIYSAGYMRGLEEHAQTRLAIDLEMYLVHRAYLQETCEAVENMLASPDAAAGPALQGWGHILAGYLRNFMGHYDAGREHALQAEPLFAGAASPDLLGQARARLLLIYCDIGSDGRISGTAMSIRDVISSAGAYVAIVASEGNPDSYTKALGERGEKAIEALPEGLP